MSKTTSELKSVLTRVVDSADGYESAAESADNGSFAVMFRERAQERRNFATEIRSHLQASGENIEEDGSLLAAAHRAFTDIRDAVTGGRDDGAILNEVARGESTLLNEYEDALKDLPQTDPAYDLLARQRQSVAQAVSSVKAQAPNQ
ncbi:ferritin-like domain-containing protein [Parvularcula maris]|uniref:PA2169 family four-helix-bundle protein n=1 Tax=Parvularcula maris TaxID=2965077 RepID=A0A9X2LB36_9PROT|nr:PA2169 family four-helix-bundle protein [Parvularcula maris]MCQ8186425.1 PA2169 family four-helix-bundle protein [Parvularcula maris]